jgi:hypothetical protein
MSDFEDQTIDEPTYTVTLSLRERQLRDKFVAEYLSDYDALQAAMRIGYSLAFAKEYSIKLMQDPYVLQQIKKTEGDTVSNEPEDVKKRIVAGLMREANFRGAGSSQSARVAAWSKLASLYQMDVVPKGAEEGEGAGEFVVPGMITEEEWTRRAAAQQTALTAPDSPAPVATPTVH